MRRYAAVSFCSLCLFILSGCTQSAANTRDSDARALRDIEANWNKDWAANDVEKICSHYADDANLLVAGMPLASGKAKIQNVIQQLISDPNLKLSFEAAQVEVAKDGDLAYTRGAYTMGMTDPTTKKAVTENGKYITIYRKSADGSWKAVQDMNNADGPATPAM